MRMSRMGSAPAGEMCQNRIVEWLCAWMLLNFAGTIYTSPDTLATGSFRYITALGITPDSFAFACGIVGLLRVTALYFNGYGLPWSARVRALSAIFGALVFSLMGLSLVFLTRDTGTLSIGAGTHFILAAGELYSCLRAGADVTEKYRRDAIFKSIEATARRDRGGSSYADDNGA